MQNGSGSSKKKSSKFIKNIKLDQVSVDGDSIFSDEEEKTNAGTI